MDTVAQEQLLAAAATAGRASQLFARLAPLVAGLTPRSSQAPLSPQLALLQKAFSVRLEARVHAGLCAPLAPVTGGERQSAALAAKVAQRVIRTYAAVATGATDSDRKQSAFAYVGEVAQCVCVVTVGAVAVAALVGVDADEDVLVAIDAAAAALFVVVTFERSLKLDELVVDNMLYQVAKKYTELPQVRPYCST